MDAGLLVLRIVVGVLMAGHGAQKLFGWFGGHGLAGTAGMMDAVGLRPARAMAVTAGLAELVGGLLFATGLLTPLAAALIIAVMGAAIASVHWRAGLWTTQGGYEYNLVLISAAFAVTAIGPGKWSLDHALNLNLDGRGWALAALAAGAAGTLAAVASGRLLAHSTLGARPRGA
jgi:putative oxidoreductase